MTHFKAKWYGRESVAIDRWAPTSKTCSDCGYRAVKMPLGVRVWTCPACGTDHDRDVNAAKNILRLAIESKRPEGIGSLRVEGTSNLPVKGAGIPGEARTVAEKLDHGDRLDRAA